MSATCDQNQACQLPRQTPWHASPNPARPAAFLLLTGRIAHQAHTNLLQHHNSMHLGAAKAAGLCLPAHTVYASLSNMGPRRAFLRFCSAPHLSDSSQYMFTYWQTRYSTQARPALMRPQASPYTSGGSRLSPRVDIPACRACLPPLCSTLSVLLARCKQQSLAARAIWAHGLRVKTA